MIDIQLLAAKVLVLLLMMIPGFLLAKFKMAPEKFGKGLANTILYASQPALIIMAYNCDYSDEILRRAAFVFLFAVLAHILATAVALVLYRRAPESVKSVLQFAMIFTNAGYMGIPLLEAIYKDTDPNIGIYASIYVVVFNMFCWSVGCYIYSRDKSYISVKKIFLNPAIIASITGFVLFLTPLNTWLDGTSLPATVVKDVLVALKATVAPLSMILIGIRMAEIEWKGVLKDRYLYPYLVIRMILMPTAVFCFVKLFALLGIYDDVTALTVLLLSAAAPAATATSMFAEIFDKNAVYAGKLVAVSTLLSIATMPLTALLLQI